MLIASQLIFYYINIALIYLYQFNKLFRIWFVEYFCKEGDLGGEICEKREICISHVGDSLKVGDWPKNNEKEEASLLKWEG